MELVFYVCLSVAVNIFNFSTGLSFSFSGVLLTPYTRTVIPHYSFQLQEGADFACGNYGSVSLASPAALVT